MKIENATGESKTTQLDAILQEGDSSARPHTVLTGHNLGSNTLTLCIPMHHFWEISEVANERNIADQKEYEGQAVAQRKLDPNHAKKLAVYILKGLVSSLKQKYETEAKLISPALMEIEATLGEQPYLALQPITANIRECKFGGKDLRVERSSDGKITVFLSDRHVLWVVDGQHRRKAIDLVFEFLKAVQSMHKYPKNPQLYSVGDQREDLSPEQLRVWAELYETARSRCKVMVETHLGLNADQERQLFHDLNNLAKKIESSLAFKFDNSNPINLFIKRELIDDSIVHVVERDVSDWHTDDGCISRKDLIAVNAILFLNKTNISGAQPEVVNERKETALKFWQTVSDITGFGEPGAKKLTVAAQPVFVKALAKLTYTFAFSRDDKNPDALRTLFEGMGRLDLSHKNLIWRYFLLSKEEQDSGFPNLAEYLPSAEGGANRDIGGFDNKAEVFRFGAKHNDIYPILGDMIRWMLKLPSRRDVIQ